MEIARGVHAVRLLGSRGYLVEGDDGLTLVDAGLRGSGPLLRWYLSRIGRAPDDIVRIVCTHGHPDHIGGVREIAAMTGAGVLMHPADSERLRITLREAVARPITPGPVIAYLTRPPGAVSALEDGASVAGLEAIHTPGHTPGSVCLYSPDRRLLIVGDVLQVVRGRISLPSQVFTEDMGEARRSIARLAELDVEIVAFAHYPAWRGGVRDALRAIAA
ncbi:MAG TPA: MBL fold metallo-hydrolase [Candidatus Limnocylindria bacterium]|nr:MBL fold metallo-hydrolase [Candidatus Limnocylindria bacterium]